MDKFVVDLDQILDDLEAQEDLFVPTIVLARPQLPADDASLQTPTPNQESHDLIRTSHSLDHSLTLLDLNNGHIHSEKLADLPDCGPMSKSDCLNTKTSTTGPCLLTSNPSHSSPGHMSPKLQKPETKGLTDEPTTREEQLKSEDSCLTESLGGVAGESCGASAQLTNDMPVSDVSLVRSSDAHDQVSNASIPQESAQAADEEAILAEVMRDVEEYEKTSGDEGGSHAFEDEELNKIMESIEDWSRKSSESGAYADQLADESDDDNGYDEDLENLTNGIVSHSSSLRPVKEISQKSIESPCSLPADYSAHSSHTHFSREGPAETPVHVLRFADCRVDSDDPDEEQMDIYLQDVSLSPNAVHDLQTTESCLPDDQVQGVTESAADHSLPSEEVIERPQNQDRAVRPNSLDLNCEPLAPATADPLTLDAVPPNNSVMHEDGVRVGYHKPFWIPDEEAPICMHCDTRFTVIKRRHHCRACGKVLCAACCNMRAKLPYMDFRETRVCSVCYPLLVQEGHAAPSAPDPLNPGDYCSTIPPSQQVAPDAASSALTVLVPVGVLKRPDRPRGQPKQVVFSDGIRPGCDLRAEVDSEPSSSAGASGRAFLHRLRSPPVEVNGQPISKLRSKVQRTVVHDAIGQLPAVLNCPSLAAEATLQNLLSIMRNEVITFYLTKNLHVQLKLVQLDCCAKLEVWSFASKGLATVGQDEIAVILERVEDEQNIPRDVFRLITSVYDSSSKGLVHSEMSHILFPDGLFGCKDHCCFLFVRQTLQCIQNLVLPPSPYLVALLIQRYEVPWAKVFPLRLVLRLGAEFASYPCPVVSYRQRKSVYCEVGHTILNVLADFRNFQYTIPVVQGVVIQRDSGAKKTTLILPRNRYDSILKILNQNNEHVLALGGNLAEKVAESHYACYQNEEGQYQTYILSSSGSAVPLHKGDADTGRIGVSFIVFSGALKSSSGVTAKMSMVEDGVLVQVMPNVIPELKKALRDMKDYDMQVGKVGQEVTDCVSVHWGPDDTCFNIGVVSPIDGRSLAGVPSLRIHNSTDFANKHFLIRWTEVFFLENQDPGRRDSIDPTKVARVVAQSLCRALTLHLDQLVSQGMQRIGLRVSLDPEQVGYEVGSNAQPLPALFVNELDEALIPVITGNFLSGMDALLVLELLFVIIVK